MKKILDLLGLSARAGKLRSGEEFALKAIKCGEAKLALVDESASGNAKRAFEKACQSFGVPLIYAPEGKIGEAIGKPGRMAATIADEGLANSMIRIYKIDNIPGGH